MGMHYRPKVCSQKPDGKNRCKAHDLFPLIDELRHWKRNLTEEAESWIALCQNPVNAPGILQSAMSAGRTHIDLEGSSMNRVFSEIASYGQAPGGRTSRPSS